MTTNAAKLTNVLKQRVFEDYPIFSHAQSILSQMVLVSTDATEMLQSAERCKERLSPSGEPWNDVLVQFCFVQRETRKGVVLRL